MSKMRSYFQSLEPESESETEKQSETESNFSIVAECTQLCP